MGAYINPPSTSKEDWLEENATEIDRPTDWDFSGEERMIVLVLNNSYSAAAIAYKPEEFQRLIIPDSRPALFYKATREKLYPVSDLKEWEES